MIFSDAGEYGARRVAHRRPLLPRWALRTVAWEQLEGRHFSVALSWPRRNVFGWKRVLTQSKKPEFKVLDSEQPNLDDSERVHTAYECGGAGVADTTGREDVFAAATATRAHGGAGVV